MGKPNPRIQQTVDTLCEELDWGLRSFYAAKVLFESELRLTPSLLDTFYFSCLDQSILILSRMVIVKEKVKRDESINLRYLANLARGQPSAFRFALPEELDALIEKQTRIIEDHAPLIAVLRNQRDRNLAHLDRHHINDRNWHKSQNRLDFPGVEGFYQGLSEILGTYHRLFYDTEHHFDQWESATQVEVKSLIEFYEAYRLKTEEP